MGYVHGSAKKRVRQPRDKRLGHRGNKGGGRFRELYAALFRSAHILPGDLARQEPRLLMDALGGDDEPELPENMDAHLKMFYGV